MDNRKKLDLEEFVKTYESEVRKMCERVKEQHGIDSGIYRSEW